MVTMGPGRHLEATKAGGILDPQRITNSSSLLDELTLIDEPLSDAV
jgi:hypothetical protein